MKSHTLLASLCVTFVALSSCDAQTSKTPDLGDVAKPVAENPKTPDKGDVAKPIELGSYEALDAIRKTWLPFWQKADQEALQGLKNVAGNQKATFVFMSISSVTGKMVALLTGLSREENMATLVTEPRAQAMAARNLFRFYSTWNELIIEPNITVVNSVITEWVETKSDAELLNTKLVEPLKRLNKEFIAVRASQLKALAESLQPK